MSVSWLTTGCYLSHLASGQWEVLRARRPIEEVLADPAVDSEVREMLPVVRRARSFAEGLGLELGDQYTSYVEWPGDRILTSVVYTRPGEIEAGGFRFPIIGRVPYKGFFDRERAHAEAEKLRAEGNDVCELRVTAYSTLGWMDDPVTRPMLLQDEGILVDTLIHELVHNTFFVKSEARFNEGVANFIGEEGSVLFYAETSDVARAEARRERIRDSRRLDVELLRLREEIQALYDGSPAGPERDAARAALSDAARGRVATLPLSSRDPAKVAERLRLNDACLALSGTYGADLGRYAEKLARDGGDLRAFVREARAAADEDDPLATMLGALPK